MLFLLIVLHAWLSLDGIATGFSPASLEQNLRRHDRNGLLLAGIFSRLTEAHTKMVRRYVKSAI